MPSKILTHRIFAIPLFLCIMFLVFYLTFNSIGAYLSRLLTLLTEQGISLISYRLLSSGVNPAFHSLIVDGICAGIGSVLSFLPRIAVMFCCLSILENSGYLPRIALIMKNTLIKFSLPGESIIPLIIGFGCSVPAIMSTRMLSSARDRYLTIALIPFMSCSAKLPIYVIFTSVFFSRHQTMVIMGIYLVGILTAILCSFVLKNTLYRGAPHSSSHPIPPYRLPSPKVVFLCVAENVVGFLKKIFTVIFMASIVIWFLQNFDTGLQITKSSEESILAFLGKQAAPFFAPLGFGNWRAASAVITGLSAKEAVVSTLAILTTTVPGSSLDIMLPQIFSPLSAFSFMVFCLLYVPCIATLASVKKELGKWRYAFITAVSQIAIAWLTSFLIFNAGSFLGENTFVLLLFTMVKMFIMDL